MAIYFLAHLCYLVKDLKRRNNCLLDMEIGLAFPTIVTGKIGFGFFIDKKEKSAIVLGIRPWPLHF